MTKNPPPSMSISANATAKPDFGDPPINPKPPGMVRCYPQPTSSGRIPFHYPTNGMQGETSYKLWGYLKSNKTPLVCLHGGPGIAHNYLLPMSLLHTDLQIPLIMYDQVGCGESSHHPDKKGDESFWTADMFCAELDNLKSHLGIQEFDLLGQSWGGILAGYYATKQPANLHKLIVCDSPASMPTWLAEAAKLRAALPEAVKDTLQRCEDEDKTESPEYEAAVTYFNRLHVCRLWPFPPELLASLQQMEQDPTVYHTMNGPNEFHVIGSLKEWSIDDALEGIREKTVPGGMMVVNGYWDEATDKAQEPFFLRPKVGVKWCRFALSGHCPWLEESEAFLEAVEAFLTDGR